MLGQAPNVPAAPTAEALSGVATPTYPQTARIASTDQARQPPASAPRRLAGMAYDVLIILSIAALARSRVRLGSYRSVMASAARTSGPLGLLARSSR